MNRIYENYYFYSRRDLGKENSDSIIIMIVLSMTSILFDDCITWLGNIFLLNSIFEFIGFIRFVKWSLSIGLQLEDQTTWYIRCSHHALKLNQSWAGTIAPSPNHFSDRSNSLVAIWFDIPPSKHQHKILNIRSTTCFELVFKNKQKLTSYLLRSQKLSSSSRCLDIVSVVIGGSS